MVSDLCRVVSFLFSLTLVARSGSGAYCSGMSTKNYNSFPEASEVLVDKEGNVHLIRTRQTLEQIYQNEVNLPGGLF